jgi:hypothetical protein
MTHNPRRKEIRIMAKKDDAAAGAASSNESSTTVGGGPGKRGDNAQVQPTQGRIIQARVLDVKIRPGIVTNVPEGQAEVIDSTIFLVPALDNGEHFAYGHNLKFDPQLSAADTWRWPPRVG